MEYTSARDWARFGQRYLDDGVLDGRCMLPISWTAYVSKSTPGSIYGFGFWTNTDTDADRSHPITGMPVDARFASGINGQRIVIVPFRRLMIVRQVPPRSTELRHARPGAPGQ